MAGCAVAVTDDQHSQRGAHPQQHKPFLSARRVWIILEECPIVEKHRLGFFERNPVLALVLSVLPLVPFEAQILHSAIVTTL